MAFEAFNAPLVERKPGSQLPLDQASHLLLKD